MNTWVSMAQPARYEIKKRPATAHKTGKCNICKESDRCISKSGWVDAYCQACRNQKRRDQYARTKNRMELIENGIS